MTRAALALRIVGRYVKVRIDLRRKPLPAIVQEYAALPPARTSHPVRRLRRGVDRLLVLPGRPMRCLPRALVMYSLLVEQGHPAQLVVGLPGETPTSRAHAWVELNGIDVGPSPGRDGHDEMVRYPLPS